MNLSRVVCCCLLVALVNASCQTIAGEPGGEFSIYFPAGSIKSPQSFSSVRVLVTCGRILGIRSIPEDWYVSTERTQGSEDPKSPGFIYSAVAVEFAAGHGVARLNDLSRFNGSIRVQVEVPSCFNVSAKVADDMSADGKTLELAKSQLELRK